jgi:PTH1 family peptidyl-tRNA hydrolase
MKIIVGLGNPGSQYERTRHNAGFMVIDRLIKRHGRDYPVRAKFGSDCVEVTAYNEKVLLMKPMAYMNRSGSPVAEALGFYKVPVVGNLFVLVDDFALALGQIRIRPDGGAGGHNGLRDIERALGTQLYARLRIGIDPKPPTFSDTADWVLSRFSDDDMLKLTPAIDRAADACDMWIKEGIVRAMNSFNVDPKPRTGA